MVGRSTGRVAFARRLGHRELVALDAAAAALLLVTYLAQLRVRFPGGVAVLPDLLVVAGMGLPVAVRRRWPVPVLGAVGALSMAAAVLDVVREPFLAVALAAYTVATTASVRWPAPTPAVGVGGAVVVVGGLVAGTPGGTGTSAPLLVLGTALVVTAWTIGWAVRERREHAERSRCEFAARTVAEERLRIARELHDVVAHDLGVVVVKAGVANHVLPDLPPAAREALTSIEAASRSALAEMRHMLGVLRTGVPAAAPLPPSTGLVGVPALVERVAAAGVAVDLRAEGVEGLPGSVDHSAYRIVQEALTNVVKHAAPTRCRVELAVDGGLLRIEVVDEGRAGGPAPRPRPRGGHGLIGMRERVALYGGHFDAGPRPGGGFAVTATLPCAAADRP